MEDIHTAEEVHVEGRQAERLASEGARAHGGGVGGLSGANHQMPARQLPAQGVVGVQSSGKGAVAALVEVSACLAAAVTIVEHA